MRRAQASLEYLFMLAVTLVLIVLLLRRFFDPRVGTIKRTGEFESDVEKNITSAIENIANGSGQ